MRDNQGIGVDGVLVRLALKDRSGLSGISRVLEVPKAGVKGEAVERKGEETQRCLKVHRISCGN